MIPCWLRSLQAVRWPPDSRRHPRSGSKVHNIIGASDRIFIMLDNQNGVAEIPQLLERMQQLVVVARVQTD